MPDRSATHDPSHCPPPDGEGRSARSPAMHSSVLIGDLDVTNVHALRGVLRSAARRGQPFDVDLTAVCYLDGAALGVLLEFAAHRPILRVRAGSAVAHVLRSLEVDRLLVVRFVPEDP